MSVRAYMEAFAASGGPVVLTPARSIEGVIEDAFAALPFPAREAVFCVEDFGEQRIALAVRLRHEIRGILDNERRGARRQERKAKGERREHFRAFGAKLDNWIERLDACGADRVPLLVRRSGGVYEYQETPVPSPIFAQRRGNA